MGVKVSKLWSNNKFNSLTKNSKLLYLYLCTSPQVSFLGVLIPNTKVLCLELNIDISELRESSKQLIEKRYIYVGKHEDSIYFIVLDHFKTLPKSDTTILRMNREIKSYPQSFIKILNNLGIEPNKKIVQFSKPTAEDVTKYASSQGYSIDGNTFVQYYNSVSEKYKKHEKDDAWFDNRGKRVIDWKGKLRRVWCKDENKIEAMKDAPKGYEYFYVMINGNRVKPDGWRDGIPYSKNFITNKKIVEAYEHTRNGSDNTEIH